MAPLPANNKTILINFNFKGEFLGVIGTVGCGKSTLLAAVLAEVNKISGRIAIADIKKGKNHKIFIYFRNKTITTSSSILIGIQLNPNDLLNLCLVNI